MRTALAVLLCVSAIGYAAAAMARPSNDYGWSSTQVLNPSGEVAVDPSAATSTVPYEWCPGVAVTTFPAAKVLTGAKNVTIDNRSTATCYGEWDGSTVTTNGASGDKWSPGDRVSQDVRADVFLVNLKVACTAATTTGACLFTRQWK